MTGVKLSLIYHLERARSVCPAARCDVDVSTTIANQNSKRQEYLVDLHGILFELEIANLIYFGCFNFVDS